MRTDNRTFSPDDSDPLIKTQSRTCTRKRQSRTWRTERKLDHSRTRLSQDFLTKCTIHWMAARESMDAGVHSLYGSPTLVPEPANMQEITSLGCPQLLSAPFPEMCVFQRQKCVFLTRSYTDFHHIKQIKTDAHREIKTGRGSFQTCRAQQDTAANRQHAAANPLSRRSLVTLPISDSPRNQFLGIFLLTTLVSPIAPSWRTFLPLAPT